MPCWVKGVHMMVSGIMSSDFDDGHEFHDQRRPSTASSSMKSIIGSLVIDYSEWTQWVRGLLSDTEFHR